MRPGKTWMIFAAIALTATLRLAAATEFGRNPLLLHPVLDDLAYRTQATSSHGNLAAGPALSRGSLLYAIVASAVPGVSSGGIRSLALAQCVLEVVSAILLALMIRRRWGNAAAAAGAALFALDPLGAFYAARFTPVAPATLCLVGAIFLWDLERSREAPSLPLGLATGIVIAVGFLLVPLPFVFLLAIRLRERILLARRAGGRPAWISALLPLVFLPAAAGIVMAHNASLTDGGAVLSWGAGPAIDRAFDSSTAGTPRHLRPPAWITDDDLRRLTSEELGRRASDIDLYRTLSARGLGRALGNPLSTLGVLVSKAVATVGSWPIPDALSPAFLAARSARSFAWLAWSFAGLLALAAAGFVLLRGDPLRDLLAQGILAVALASLLGLASAASRQVAVPLMAALGGGWIAGAAGRSADRFRRTPLAFLAAALVVSVATGLFGPARAFRNPSEDLRLLASTFEQTMSTRQAVPILEEAVRHDPRNLEARLALARAYLEDALPAAAIQQLEAAYAADSTNAAVTAALAARRFENGQQAEGLALMKRLVGSHPRNAGYLRDYGVSLSDAGRMPEAENMLSRAVSLDPSDEAAMRSLQELVSLRMSMENALFPDELRTVADSTYSAMLPHIIDSMEAGRWAQADSMLSWAERTHGQLATTSWIRAGYYARRGNLPAAITALERCQRIAPGRPAVVRQLTQLYLQTNQRAKVPPLFRESLAAARADSVISRQLRTMAQQLGLPRE